MHLQHRSPPRDRLAVLHGISGMCMDLTLPRRLTKGLIFSRRRELCSGGRIVTARTETCFKHSLTCKEPVCMGECMRTVRVRLMGGGPFFFVCVCVAVSDLPAEPARRSHGAKCSD